MHTCSVKQFRSIQSLAQVSHCCRELAKPQPVTVPEAQSMLNVLLVSQWSTKISLFILISATSIRKKFEIL